MKLVSSSFSFASSGSTQIATLPYGHKMAASTPRATSLQVHIQWERVLIFALAFQQRIEQSQYITSA